MPEKLRIYTGDQLPVLGYGCQYETAPKQQTDWLRTAGLTHERKGGQTQQTQLIVPLQ